MPGSQTVMPPIRGHQLSGWAAAAQAAPLLLAPLAAASLAFTHAPPLLHAVVMLALLPLALTAGFALFEPVSRRAFMFAQIWFAAGAAVLMWMSGGFASPMGYWLVALLALAATHRQSALDIILVLLAGLCALAGLLAAGPPVIDVMVGVLPADWERMHGISLMGALLAVAIAAWPVSSPTLPTVIESSRSANEPLLILRLDDAGIIRQAQGAHALFGLNDDRLIGLSFLDLVHPDDRDALNKGLEGRMRRHALVLRINLGNSGHSWMEARLQDDQLQLRRRWTNKMPTGDNDGARSEFLANMSHELRTPLNAIIGFTDILRNELFGELNNQRYRDYAKLAHDSGVRLLDMVDDLLDMSRIEAGRYGQTHEAVELRSLIEGRVRAASTRAQELGAAIEAELPTDLPDMLTDRLALRRLVSTLLADALRDTVPGAMIRISVAYDPATLSIALSVDAPAQAGTIGLPEAQPYVARETPARIDLFVAEQIARSLNGRLVHDQANGRQIVTAHLPLQTSRMTAPTRAVAE